MKYSVILQKIRVNSSRKWLSSRLGVTNQLISHYNFWQIIKPLIHVSFWSTDCFVLFKYLELVANESRKKFHK